MPFKYKSGEHALRNLHGMFCVYKPEGMKMRELILTVKTKLIEEMNALPNYFFETTRVRLQPSSQQLIERSGDDNPDMLVADSSGKLVGLDSHLPTQTNSSSVALLSQKQLSEGEILNNRLVLGDRYEPLDLQLFANTALAQYSSGLIVMGSGSFKYKLRKMSTRYVQVYHVKGRLGWASDNYGIRGRIVERSTFRHVNRSLVEKVCASIEADHQRKMFDYAGVNPESQEAYELATQGLLRPVVHHKEPLIYSLKCVAFDLPHFTLEIHAINEKCFYLAEVIHSLGLLMKSTAVCAGIRRIRSGVYDINYALLYQDWKLNKITNNIKDCKAIRPTANKNQLSPTLGYLREDNKGVFKSKKNRPVPRPLNATERLKLEEKEKLEKEVQMLLSSKLVEENPVENNGNGKE